MRDEVKYDRDGSMTMPETLTNEQYEIWVSRRLYVRHCIYEGYFEKAVKPYNLLGMSARDVLDSMGDLGDRMTVLELAVLCLRANDVVCVDGWFDSEGVAGRAQDVFSPKHVHEVEEGLAERGLLERRADSRGCDVYRLSEETFGTMRRWLGTYRPTEKRRGWLDKGDEC